MLRFFFGLTLAQLVVAALVSFSPLSNLLEQALLMGFVILLVSIVTTLWFGTVAKHMADKRIALLKKGKNQCQCRTRTKKIIEKHAKGN